MKISIYFLAYIYAFSVFSAEEILIERDFSLTGILLQTVHEGDDALEQRIKTWQVDNKLSDIQTREALHRLLSNNEQSLWLKNQILISSLGALALLGDESSLKEISIFYDDTLPFTDISFTAYMSVIMIKNFEEKYVFNFIEKSISENKPHYCVTIVRSLSDKYIQSTGDEKEYYAETLKKVIKLLIERTEYRWMERVLADRGLSISSFTLDAADSKDENHSDPENNLSLKISVEPDNAIENNIDSSLQQSVKKSDGDITSSKMWLWLSGLFIIILAGIFVIFKRKKQRQ